MERPVAPLQGEVSWKAAKENPENPSDVTLNTEFPDRQWWVQFSDEHLTRYIDQALSENHQLQIAQARITEARASTRSAISRLFPTIQFGPSFIRQKTSANQFPTFGGGGVSSFGSFVLKPFNIWTVPLQATYEADFLLKNWDNVRATRRQAEAIELDYKTAMIALITDVSSTYFNLMASDKLIQLQKDYVDYSELDLEAEKARQSEGLASQEAVVIKEGILADARAALQDYYRLQAIYENQMAILIARPPELAQDLPRSDLDRFEVPGAVNAGVPSELITRRPDVVSAEKMLESSRINVLIARKNFLPTFNLTGSYGYASTQLNTLFDKDSKTWSYSATGIQGLFEGGAKVAGLKASKARYQQQLHQYQQVILNSLLEVDNAISSLKTHKNAYKEYQATNASLEQQLGFQQARLEEGVVAASDLYPTQIQIVQSQQGLVQAKLLGLVDSLELYKALGGGF
ncbi:MAG: efflux transporter outer membrane subunit [Vampirovibrionales bacterium]|nr:efflux transporter outer membrane subunit [Vampirovibrionales bacterium]